MRLALLASALALAACGPRAPQGSAVIKLDPSDRDFRFDAGARRVLFVRGAYPGKTYAGSADLAAGRLSVHRSSGRAISGSPWRRASSSRALFRAAPIVDGYAGEVPKGDIILDAAPGDPGSDRTLQLEGGRLAPCITETGWSRGVLVAAAPAGRAAKLGRWRDSSAALDVFADLPPGIVDCAASTRSPTLGLLIVEKTTARFVVWNVEKGSQSSALTLPPEPRIVGRAEDGRLFAALVRKDSDERLLAALDPETGTLKELFTSTETIVSATALPSGVAVLLRDEQASGGLAAHLKPQCIVKLGEGGRVEWTKAWSRLPSELVGFDAASGRLVVAVIDTAYAGLWAVPTEEPGFAAAVGRIEQETSPLRRRIGTAFQVVLFGAFFLTLVLGLLHARG